MSYRCTLLAGSLLLSFTLQAQSPHTNVLISTANQPEEPSIAINPKNTLELVAGANIASQYYSTNGGATWTTRLLSSPYGVYGDPCVLADTTGAFYFLHLANPNGQYGPYPFIDRMQVQRATTAAAPFAFRGFFGLNPPKQQDKEWVAVNPRTNALYATWTEFDTYGSLASRDSTRILFSKSLDQGQTWTPGRRISKIGGDAADEDNTVEGAVPAVGPKGEIYTAWAGPLGLTFNRSLDDGLTWLPKERVITAVPGGWDFAIAGIYRANGLPITACDLSHGPNRGTIYVNWSDQRNGPSDTNVWLVSSTDGGLSWSAPRRVNNDAAGHQQFLTWMTIDQATGYLWFVFYDRRNYPTNATETRTDVYAARSTDGGLTFQNFRISQSPFTPTEGVFFGDYTNITAHNNVVRPIWTRLDNQQLSIWTALIDGSSVLAAKSGAALPDLSLQVYPNPAREVVQAALQLPAAGVVSVRLLSPDGRVLRTVLHEEALPVGQRLLSIPVGELTAGVYWLEAQVGGHSLHHKVTVLR